MFTYFLDKNFGVFSYNEKEASSKKSAAKPKSHYYSAKKNYVTSRGESWFLSNKRPDHLRDNLLELEKYLKTSKVVGSACNNGYYQVALHALLQFYKPFHPMQLRLGF